MSDMRRQLECYSLLNAILPLLGNFYILWDKPRGCDLFLLSSSQSYETKNPPFIIPTEEKFLKKARNFCHLNPSVENSQNSYSYSPITWLLYFQPPFTSRHYRSFQTCQLEAEFIISMNHWFSAQIKVQGYLTMWLNISHPWSLRIMRTASPLLNHQEGQPPNHPAQSPPGRAALLGNHQHYDFCKSCLCTVLAETVTTKNSSCLCQSPLRRCTTGTCTSHGETAKAHETPNHFQLTSRAVISVNPVCGVLGI